MTRSARGDTMEAVEVCHLYRMDRNYRAFCNAQQDALNCGILALEDDLNASQGAVERLYKNWFLTELNERWTDALSQEPPEAERLALDGASVRWRKS